MPPQKKPNIKIIPYGIDYPKEKIINKREKNETFKIFFAGRPSLSKGIQYVIQSTKQLDFPWQIEIAGSIPENPDKISKNIRCLTCQGQSVYDSQSEFSESICLTDSSSRSKN